jgi:hypothetical protein
MTRDLNSELNQLTTRLSRLEQKSMFPTTGVADISYDPETSLTTVDDHIDWSLARNGWEPYSTVSDIIYDDVAGEITDGGELSTPYGRPETHLVGSMCVLTGMVRRKAGASNLVAGTRYDLPLFGLPEHWRPMANIVLSCVMGNVNPDPDLTPLASVVSTAWIEIRPALDPLENSGVVSYVTGTSALTAGTGWIALQGIFPCHIIDVTGLDQG